MKIFTFFFSFLLPLLTLITALPTPDNKRSPTPGNIGLIGAPKFGEFGLTHSGVDEDLNIVEIVADERKRGNIDLNGALKVGEFGLTHGANTLESDSVGDGVSKRSAPTQTTTFNHRPIDDTYLDVHHLPGVIDDGVDKRFASASINPFNSRLTDDTYLDAHHLPTPPRSPVNLDLNGALKVEDFGLTGGQTIDPTPPVDSDLNNDISKRNSPNLPSFLDQKIIFNRIETRAITVYFVILLNGLVFVLGLLSVLVVFCWVLAKICGGIEAMCPGADGVKAEVCAGQRLCGVGKKF